MSAGAGGANTRNRLVVPPSDALFRCSERSGDEVSRRSRGFRSVQVIQESQAGLGDGWVLQRWPEA
jgi:hypothetical protein